MDSSFVLCPVASRGRQGGSDVVWQEEDGLAAGNGSSAIIIIKSKCTRRGTRGRGNQKQCATDYTNFPLSVFRTTYWPKHLIPKRASFGQNKLYQPNICFGRILAFPVWPIYCFGRNRKNLVSVVHWWGGRPFTALVGISVLSL